MTDLEEALRSELRYRAEAADREVSLFEPVARRVRRAHRWCALTASTLTTIAATAIAVAVPASSVLQPAATSAGSGGIMAPSPARFGPSSVVNGPGIASGYGAPYGGFHGSVIEAGLGSRRGAPGIDLPVITAGPEAGRVPPVSDPVLAQSVGLAYGPRGRVPAGWRWHDIGGIDGIRFAAPASWAIRQDGRRGRCSDGIALTTVVLSTATVRYAPGCSQPPRFLYALNTLYHLTKSLDMGTARLGPDAVAEPAPNPTVSLCQRLDGVRACVLWPDGSLLKVAVFPPGAAGPILVEIGSAGSVATARAIFGSIRPVLGRRVMPPRWGRRAVPGA